MKQLKAKIAEHKRIAPRIYKMRLESAYLAKNSKPGQFVEVKCSEGGGVLLRRPFGVHRISNGGIEILYEVIGKGTESLSARKKGDHLDIIGPLGNGFFVHRSSSIVHRTAILAAGGVGVAPLLALAEELRRRKDKVIAMIGAKTKSRVLCEDEFKSLGCEVKISTEDGSEGKKGLITETLRHLLSTINYELPTIYACGPNPMLKEVGRMADSSGIPCQVSMEERMACGVGVCLGCPVKVKVSIPGLENRNTKYEYKMVCKDGPVFDAKEIAW